MTETRKYFSPNVIASVLLRGFVPDIFKAYFDFKGSFWNQLRNGLSEARLLAYAFFISIVLFLERLPDRISNNHLDPVNEKLLYHVGTDLFVSIFFVPVFFYALSAAAHLVSLLFKGDGTFFKARVAFFWSTVVASPVLLITGLVQGIFNGLLWAQVIQHSAALIYAWIFSSIFCTAEGFSSNLPLFFVLLFGYIFLSYVAV